MKKIDTGEKRLSEDFYLVDLISCCKLPVFIQSLVVGQRPLVFLLLLRLKERRYKYTRLQATYEEKKNEIYTFVTRYMYVFSLALFY